MVNNNFIELKDLSFFYKKDAFILKNLNLKIFSGKITALLGINGSGKTTLFKILTGIYKHTTGFFYYNDMLINDNNISFYKKDLGFMPEFLNLYKDMTVREVLSFLCSLKEHSCDNLDELLSCVFLLEHSNKKVKALSKGMKQRLNLAQAIIGNPKIVIFDEPSNGFDCGSITMFYSVLRKLADNGAIVLLSSHHLTEISSNVDHVFILSNGHIIKNFDFINNFSDDIIYSKEVFLLLDRDVDDIFLYSFKKYFPSICLKNFRLLKAKLNNKDIVNLIVLVLNNGFSILDIRVDNKILEDILIGLS